MGVQPLVERDTGPGSLGPGSADDLLQQRQSPLRLCVVALGELEVHVPSLVPGVVDLDDPALARGRRQLAFGGEREERHPQPAEVRALPGADDQLRLGRAVAARPDLGADGAGLEELLGGGVHDRRYMRGATPFCPAPRRATLTSASGLLRVLRMSRRFARWICQGLSKKCWLRNAHTLDFTSASCPT